MIDSSQYDEFDSALINIVGFVVNNLLLDPYSCVKNKLVNRVVAYS